MAYEPTEWKSGDVVTSAKLNKLEQAVAGCSLVVHATTEDDVATLDKTWQEIFDAFSAGANVVVLLGEEGGEEDVESVAAVYVHLDKYVVQASLVNYLAASTSDYPTDSAGDDPGPSPSQT